MSAGLVFSVQIRKERVNFGEGQTVDITAIRVGSGI